MSWFRRHAEEPRQAPSWPQHAGHPRVLIEDPDPIVRDILERDLAARGYVVLTCGGPDLQASAVVCPVLRQQPCPAVQDADVVVSSLPLTRPITRMIVRRIARRGETPLILAAPPMVAHAHADGLGAQHVHPLTVDSVAEAIEAVTTSNPG